ncbi:MAG: 2-isopropylmalate synthase [Anaerolineales bacterium]|nr:2-isopropylmalate synthase [Anaerolineales bacterium]
MSGEYIRFFDTTLRDGEQSPGASLTSTEKLEIARSLARLGVDVIEAGFPAASPDDFQAVQRIAKEVGDPKGGKKQGSIICGLARALESDINTAWEAVKPALKPRIHTFLATSPVHMKHKLGMEPEEVLARVGEMVSYARSLCSDVEFSPEDASRSDPDFLYRVLEQAIIAGATTLNIPDTVGYATPEEFQKLISGIIANTPGIESVILSVHCHDDLGLATANTLAGIQAGARQVEVTVNGIGERAGNTSLEEIALTLYTRQPIYQFETGIDTTQITRISRLVSNYTGIPVQPNKAIVGENAFAHEAGIHQDGMLKNNNTYEIMRPETVGLQRSRLVLGKHSGRHALQVRLDELGFSLEDEELSEIFHSFKLLADKKKAITDADLEALVEDQVYRAEEIFSLDGLQVACGTMGLPTATVRLRDLDGGIHVQASVGTGPVDAAFKAVDTIIQVPTKLLEFTINAVTEGIDAIGEVTVRLEPQNGFIPLRTSPQSGLKRPRSFGGYGADTDIIVASVKAYLSGLNKLLNAKEFIERAELGTIKPQPNKLPN